MGRIAALAAALGWSLIVPLLGFAQEGDAFATGVAAVRVAHLAVDAGVIGVSMGAGAGFLELEPSTATGYRLVPAGDTVLAATLAGAGSRVQGPGGPREGASVTLREGAYYTLLLIDEAAGSEGALVLGGGARGYLLQDALDAFPAAGQAWVRVVQALDGGSSLSARATPLDGRRRPDPSGDARATAIAAELPYGAHADWVTLPAGVYALEHEAVGASDLEFRTDVTLHGGTLYSLFVYRSSSGPSLLVTVDAVLRDTPAGATAVPESVP